MGVVEEIGEADGLDHPRLQQFVCFELADKITGEYHKVRLDQGLEFWEGEDLSGARVEVQVLWC